MTASARPKPVVGRYVPEPLADDIYRLLLSRPAGETVDGRVTVVDLVNGLRGCKPLTREPK